MRRAQIAVEYLSLIALSLAVLLPLWVYVDGEAARTRAQLNVGYANQAVNRLRDAADLVYAQGPPAQMVVRVEAPRGVESASVAGNTISLELATPWGVSTVFAETVGPLQGSLDSFGFEGPKFVLVKAEEGFDSTFVNVSEEF